MALTETSYGKLAGREENGILSFKGIPFAKPPIGDLRWRAPEPPEPWSGVRSATEFGPCAVQSTIPGSVGELIGIATHEVSEDCLYLNVWTPAVDDGKRPVMVWIHGGGNTVGAGSQPRVDGTHLAHIGDVVVVTLNYRLGALGFLYSPELGATGNEALLDQCLAMRWVRSEIASFGGDPKNVTVFGQSAGGFDIAQLMAMEDAHGCFDKMVPMSGSLSPQVLPEAAHRTASALADHFGGFDKLRGIPASEVHAHQSRIPGARWGPTRDGQIIAKDAGDALGSGEFTKTMPLLIGHTRDESTLFTALNPQMASMDQSQLLNLMNSTFEERGKEAVDCYEESRQRAGLRCNPIDIWAAVSTDRMFRMPAIRTAELHQSHTQKTWMYRFDHESPAHDGALQATHSLDIPFVWGTYGLPQMERFCGTSGVAELSRCVMASYLEFARHGNPSNDLVPDWPQYEPTKRSTMLFGNDVGIADAPLDETRNWLVSQS